MNANFIFVIFLLLNFNIGLAQNVNHTDNEPYNKISSERFDLKFPRDHNAHKEFKIEWWYITANLKNENGDSFGIQWTLFRSRSELDNNKVTKHFKNFAKNFGKHLTNIFDNKLTLIFKMFTNKF